MNENSRLWWALIEEIAPRAEEMAAEKKIAYCVRVAMFLGPAQLSVACCMVNGESLVSFLT